MESSQVPSHSAREERCWNVFAGVEPGRQPRSGPQVWRTLWEEDPSERGGCVLGQPEQAVVAKEDVAVQAQCTDGQARPELSEVSDASHWKVAQAALRTLLWPLWALSAHVPHLEAVQTMPSPGLEG